MRFWNRRRARRREIDAAAHDWLSRHGKRAYGLARERIHEAWRLGDYAERDRWMQIRAVIRRMLQR
jgi:hypothetical protein